MANRPKTFAAGVNAKAIAYASTALGENAIADRPYEVSLGSKYSPYSLPGLAQPGRGFVGDVNQNSGEKRFVTTDNNGMLGTTSFSVDNFIDSVNSVGALSAALGSLPSSTLLPDETLRCGIATGAYGNQFAGSLGCALKLKKRLFINGGIAASPTGTIAAGPLMGRIGFSFGFGGSAPKSHQNQLSQILGIQSGTSLAEFGGALGVHANTHSQSELADQPELLNDQIKLAKQSVLISSSSATANAPKTVASDVTLLRQRLAELEEEIASLQSEAQADHETDAKIMSLMKLLEEKENREKELSLLLEGMQRQLAEQQRLINVLLKRSTQAVR